MRAWPRHRVDCKGSCICIWHHAIYAGTMLRGRRRGWAEWCCWNNLHVTSFSVLDLDEFEQRLIREQASLAKWLLDKRYAPCRAAALTKSIRGSTYRRRVVSFVWFAPLTRYSFVTLNWLGYSNLHIGDQLSACMARQAWVAMNCPGRFYPLCISIACFNLHLSLQDLRRRCSQCLASFRFDWFV